MFGHRRNKSLLSDEDPEEHQDRVNRRSWSHTRFALVSLVSWSRMTAIRNSAHTGMTTSGKVETGAVGCDCLCAIALAELHPFPRESLLYYGFNKVMFQKLYG